MSRTWSAQEEEALISELRRQYREGGGRLINWHCLSDKLGRSISSIKAKIEQLKRKGKLENE